MAVEWARSARRDLARIFAFNEGFSEDYARRVDRRLLERAGKLDANPYMGRPIGDGPFRQLSVTDVQYVMIDAVTRAGVRILSIHHTRESRERP